mmetsp:Transcript_38726/g.74370  ORF Transcript_38726/g.74370 Transcript_38726/m.74370 type:complete len:432 (+) Transcript_38726:117-1412(+)
MRRDAALMGGAALFVVLWTLAEESKIDPGPKAPHASMAVALEGSLWAPIPTKDLRAPGRATSPGDPVGKAASAAPEVSKAQPPPKAPLRDPTRHPTKAPTTGNLTDLAEVVAQHSPPSKECKNVVILVVNGLLRKFESASGDSILNHVYKPLASEEDTCVSTVFCCEDEENAKKVPAQLYLSLNAALFVAEHHLNPHSRMQMCYRRIMGQESTLWASKDRITHFVYTRPDTVWHGDMPQIGKLHPGKITARARFLAYFPPRDLSDDYISYNDSCQFPTNWGVGGVPRVMLGGIVKGAPEGTPLQDVARRGMNATGAFNRCAMLDDQFAVIPRRYGPAWFEFWTKHAKDFTPPELRKIITVDKKLSEEVYGKDPEGAYVKHCATYLPGNWGENIATLRLRKLGVPWDVGPFPFRIKTHLENWTPKPLIHRSC